MGDQYAWRSWVENVSKKAIELYAMEVVEIYEKRRELVWKKPKSARAWHEDHALNSSTLFMYFKQRVPPSLEEK